MTADGETAAALAINEVALLRQSYQAAKIRITIDGKVRLDELALRRRDGGDARRLDGLQSLGHGPILPLEAPLLALTPVSPFRPRRWRGALLSNRATVRFDILEAEKRPVNAVRRPYRGQVRGFGHRAGIADRDRDAAVRRRAFLG